MYLQFQQFADGKPRDVSLEHPLAIGPESVPVPGEISSSGGQIKVGPVEAATGLGLLWDMGEQGAYALETTRLPPRAAPYNLNLELARCRLMKLLQKIEEWGLAESQEGRAWVAKFRVLQEEFAEALVLQRDAAAAAKVADGVLKKSLDFSDELTLFQADLGIAKRRGGVGFARHTVGCRVDWTIRNGKYRDAIPENFDYAIVPMTWRLLQPEEDAFETGALDECLEFLAKKRVPIIAGPLIELDEASLPNWLFIWEYDYATLRDLAFEFVSKVVSRYRKHVAVWNVAGGMHVGGPFNLSFEQTIEFTRLLVSQVKAMLPQARTLVSIRHPFGEQTSGTRPGVPPLLYAEMVSQAGVNCDGFGVELETGVPTTGGTMRDLFQVSCLMDKLATTGKPIFVTSAGVPSRETPDPEDRSEGALDPSLAGRWRKPWTPASQAEWMDSMYRVLLSKPFVESVAWADLADTKASVPGGGLLNDMWQAKPSLMSLKKIRETYARK